MKDIELCPHCGAKMIKYTHSLKSGALVKILFKFYALTKNGIESINPAKTNFTYNECSNFQKLRYWGFVERLGKDGLWKMTYRGIEFIHGRQSVKINAISYRGVFDSFEGESVFIEDIKGFSYQKRVEFLETSKNLSEVEV